MQDTRSRLEQVRALVRKIDVPVRQVMIEARIVEASDTFTRNLGVRLGAFDRGTATGPAGNTLLGSDNRVAPSEARSMRRALRHADRHADPDFCPDARRESAGQRVSTAATPACFRWILFNSALSKFLNMEVTALQADGKGKIISSPRVITADQVEATIEQGTEIPYQQATSSGATSVAFKKATLSLKVKPQITPDDNIIMDLNVHKDSVGTVTTAGPSIDTKQITTNVLVQNGGTVVIGGIYTQSQSDQTTKVPVFGDLPYVGFLFRTNSKQDDRNELLIFISPRIMKSTVSLR